MKRRWLLVLEATTYTYKDIWAAAIGEVLDQVCFTVKLYSCKIFSYVFCVREYFYNEKKVNYGTYILY